MNEASTERIVKKEEFIMRLFSVPKITEDCKSLINKFSFDESDVDFGTGEDNSFPNRTQQVVIRSYLLVRYCSKYSMVLFTNIC